MKITKENLLVYSILFCTLTLYYSCNTTEPPNGDNGNGDAEPDTTSQNFTFETFEFGDGFESSYFNDVWVFDEKNIWAVGYIGPSDTIDGLYISNPNIIRWDGVSWKIEPFSGTSSGINGIWAVDSTTIYFASGGIRKYKEGTYSNVNTNLGLTNGQRIEKLWGSSESNIWGVGPWGTIVHFDGQQWRKIDFDTQWYFYEITGNTKTGIAYAVARNQFDDCIVIKLQNSAAEIIYQKSKSQIPIASWTITGANKELFLVSSDFESTKICRLSLIGEVEMLFELNPYIGIKGSFAFHKKDIYFIGDEGSELRFVHYNGVRFQTFNLPNIDPDNYGGIYAIKDLAVAAGFSNNKAYLLKIKRGSQ